MISNDDDDVSINGLKAIEEDFMPLYKSHQWKFFIRLLVLLLLIELRLEWYQLSKVRNFSSHAVYLT